MINNKFETLRSQLKKTKQTEMIVAAHTQSSVNTVRKVLAGSVNIHIESLVSVADFLGLDVEIRYMPKKEVPV